MADTNELKITRRVVNGQEYLITIFPGCIPADVSENEIDQFAQKVCREIVERTVIPPNPHNHRWNNGHWSFVQSIEIRGGIIELRPRE